MSAMFEIYVRKTVGISEASKLAQAWKSAAPATRRAAVKRLGDGFKVQVEGTRTTFQFFASGKVVTFNAKPQPRYRTPMHVDVDESRPLVGFAHGRPIYA